MAEQLFPVNDSVDVDAVVRALQANDPAVTELNLGEVTDQVAPPLWQALAQNTVVAEVGLVITPFLSLDGVRGLTRFIARSSSLRTLVIGMNAVRISIFSEDAVAVAKLLLEAASCSHTIEYLHLDHSCKCTVLALVSCLRGLRESLKGLHVPKLTDENEDLWGLLANTICELPFLESLNMSIRGRQSLRGDLANVGALVAGDNANQSLRKLRLCYRPQLYISTEAERKAIWTGVVNIVNQGLAPQLKELVLQRFPLPTAEGRLAFVRALGKNTSLHKVRVDYPPSRTSTRYHLPSKVLEYLGKRNKYLPQLPRPADAPSGAGSSTMYEPKFWLPDFFQKLWIECTSDADDDGALPALSIMYDTLRGRSDWVPVVTSPASNKRKHPSSSNAL